jgi:hypothetical protein
MATVLSADTMQLSMAADFSVAVATAYTPEREFACSLAEHGLHYLTE